MATKVRMDEEIAELHREIVDMGGMAKGMVDKGVRCLLTGDAALRTEMADLDRGIYRQEQVIEKHCLELIALYQPVASDLRMISTCLKIITDLNRIGRYGRDIAELSVTVDQQQDIRRIAAIPLMADQAAAMVSESIRTFVERDSEAARNLFVKDDEVDSLWNSIFREALTYMIEDPRNITVGTHLILTARYLERIADHACNIGERVVFMVTGTRLDPYARKKPPRLNGQGGGKVTSTDGYYAIPLDEK
ncbi:MAG: phosphate signaling complex protein PhoU [Methanomassiliicoccus sp.]|nr:phosphate signaling complex protein PhoU [Methanomassiliicoccus sp.]